MTHPNFLKTLLSIGLLSAASLSQANTTTVEVSTSIPEVQPEMLNWWWNNIRTEARYVDWNPEHHLAYEQLQAPADPTSLHYQPGTSQSTTDYLSGFPVNTVTTWAEQQQSMPKTHQLVADIQLVGFEDLGPAAQLVYDYDVNETLDGTDVLATLTLPAVAQAAYPGIVDASVDHITTDLQRLGEFLPELFQQEFIEDELESRGTYRVENNGFWLKTVIVDQEIKGLTPDMMNWWWDNIDSTYRYQRWHPTAHLSFEWLEAPSSPNNTTYSVGAVQRVVEYLGPYKNALLITWLPKEDAADRVEYQHWLYAKTDLDGLNGIMPQDMIHEYQLNETGDGIVMRSTFNVPFFLNWVMPGFTDELGNHALQEMQMLQYFLPELFAEQNLD